MGHQLDHFARGEVLTGGLVGGFGEFPDELFENLAHHLVGHAVGVQVDLGEHLGQLEKQVLFIELAHAFQELEALENVPRVRRKLADVLHHVQAHELGVGQQARQVENRGVVEGLLAFALEKDIQADPGVLALLVLGENVLFGGLQHAFQAAQEREGEDDLSVVGLLVIAPQEVGDGPEEVCEFREILGHGVLVYFVSGGSEGEGAGGSFARLA